MTNSLYEQLKDDLGYLGLTRSAECFALLAEEAKHGEWSHIEYLARVIGEQANATLNRKLAARLRFARFPFRRNLSDFDFEFQPSVDRKLIEDLATLRFIEENRPILFLGQPGCGKTHLAVALATTAVEAGFRGYFTTADDMVNTLVRAQREGTFGPKLKTLTAPSVLVIDDVGLLPIERRGSERAHINASSASAVRTNPAQVVVLGSSSSKRKAMSGVIWLDASWIRFHLPLSSSSMRARRMSNVPMYRDAPWAPARQRRATVTSVGSAASNGSRCDGHISPAVVGYLRQESRPPRQPRAVSSNDCPGWCPASGAHYAISRNPTTVWRADQTPSWCRTGAFYRSGSEPDLESSDFALRHPSRSVTLVYAKWRAVVATLSYRRYLRKRTVDVKLEWILNPCNR
jgi:DNA replication protein DnaC